MGAAQESPPPESDVERKAHRIVGAVVVVEESRSNLVDIGMISISEILTMLSGERLLGPTKNTPVGMKKWP